MSDRRVVMTPASEVRTRRVLLEPRWVADAVNKVTEQLILPDGRSAASVIVSEATRMQEAAEHDHVTSSRSSA